jgi:hypothetical protein
MKRFIVIILLSALLVWCGSGCGSLRNVKEIDFGITGLEMEFYPSHPSQEEKSIFDFGSVGLDEKFKIGYVPSRLMKRNK